MLDFQNQTIIITGGANGIGLAATQLLLAQGANVAVWDINHGKLDNLLENKKLHFEAVDVTHMSDCERAAAATIAKFGKIEVLINNAGITRDAAFLSMTTDQWQKVLDVNLTGLFNVTKCVAPNMVENKYGRIINTSSVVAHYGNFGQANYAATKGAVISFTKTLARELGKHNITVNAVAPGFIETDIIKTIPQKVLDGLIYASALKRAGKAEDVAKAYAFLASENANYITASVINVDGGLSF